MPAHQMTRLSYQVLPFSALSRNPHLCTAAVIITRRRSASPISWQGVLQGTPFSLPLKLLPLPPSYLPGVHWCNLWDVLPEFVCHAIAEALPQMEKASAASLPPMPF
jgi:hypothetical protein